MQGTVAILNSWSGSWSMLIVAMLWQSTLLALLVATVCWSLRRASPAIRYWLWQIVAIKLLLIPIWTVSLPVPWLAGGTSDVRSVAAAPSIPSDPMVPAVDEAAPPAQSSSNQPVASVPQQKKYAPSSTAARALSLFSQMSWTSWLMLSWLVVVVGQIVVVFWQRARLRSLLRRAKPAGAELAALVAESARSLGMARVPPVVQVDEQCSPFVCGVLRPLVVLPTSIDSLVPREQLTPVLVHELAHIQRLDLLWNWTPQIARMLFFFHPVAHWVAFRTRLEAELACDGWAMSTTGSSAGDYAELLIRVVSRLSEPAILRSGAVASAGLDGRQRLPANFPAGVDSDG